MRDYYGKPIRCPLDCVIRIIQLRLEGSWRVPEL